MAKTVIILGATGLIGSLVLEFLLSDERYSSVKLFSRKSVGKKHPKLKEFIVDVLDLHSAKDDFTLLEIALAIATMRTGRFSVLSPSSTPRTATEAPRLTDWP